MLNKSDYLRNLVIRSALRGEPFPVPNMNQLYVGLLYDTVIDGAGPFNECSDTAFPGYARASVLFGLTSVVGEVQNSIEVRIGPATAQWAGIKGIAVYDAQTSGNVLYWGNISPDLTVNAGKQVGSEVGGMLIRET
jgi:hypothetical protein